MLWVRSALASGLLMLSSVSLAAAEVQVCVDDQNSCPALPGESTTTADQSADPDTQTIGPPVSVDPFAVAPTPTEVPQSDRPVIAPGPGADKQHLPPGPPNFKIDP